MASGGSNGPSPLSSRSELPPPEHVLDRIRTITGELHALEAEMYGQITDPAELLERRSLLEQAGAAEVLVDFKTALDQLRSILWFCEAGSPGIAGESSPPDREHELARATELLRALSPSAFPTHKESGSFFERLDRVIDGYMQEGVSAKRPAGRSKI